MGEQERGDGQERDSVAAELEAMRQIAKVLDTLRDADARQRVMRWAQDRYCVNVAPPPSAVTNVGADPALALEELGDLFGEPRSAAGAPETDGAKPRVGVESMIKDFAADFRRFALDWQGS